MSRREITARLPSLRRPDTAYACASAAVERGKLVEFPNRWIVLLDTLEKLLKFGARQSRSFPLVGKSQDAVSGNLPPAFRRHAVASPRNSFMPQTKHRHCKSIVTAKGSISPTEPAS